MKITRYILAFGLILLGLNFSKASTAEPILNVILPSSSFYDVSDNYWAYTEIKELYRRGVIAGYPDNKFRPEAPISREEFTTIAVKALKLNDAEVLDPLEFDDFFVGDWAWDNVQNAYYFGLLTPPRATKDGYYFFNPQDNIIRAHAITIAVNALKTQPLTTKKAKATLEYAYDDFYKIPNWFLVPAAKAQIFDMLVIDPRKPKLINYDKPITRAETAVLIYNMMEEAKTNPNDKIKKAMTKKVTANGHILVDAYLEDETIAVIPKGTILPLVITGKLSSQKAVEGEKYTALVPKNFIHGNKYLLLPSGTKFYGHVKNTKKGLFLFRNGVLTIENDQIEVFKQPAMRVEGIADIKTEKSNSRYRKIFKGEKLSVDRGQFINLKLLQDIRIDVTTGKLIRTPEL